MEFIDLLQKVFGNHEGVDLKIDSIKESSCTVPGQNFMSVVSIARVVGTFPNGEPYSKSVFVKRPTPRDSQPFSVDDAFNNEVLMYLKVLPLITEAAHVTRVPCPYYYHVSDDVILLEDLSHQGYSSGDSAQGFDLTTARTIVKKLAKFHAASLHTRIVQQGEFEEATRELKPLGLTVSSNRPTMESCLNRAIRYIEAEEDIEAAAKFLRQLRGKVTEKMRELRNPSSVVVLVHGDFWINNILSKSNDGISENPKDTIRMIDFQACAILSPAVDFWLFLYTSVSPDILENNCDSFVQLYTSAFLEALHNENTPAEQIPSEESIKDEIELKELYGFLVGMAYLPALYLKRELIGEMAQATEEEKKDERFLDKFVDPEFRERLIKVARYAHKKGILKT